MRVVTCLSLEALLHAYSGQHLSSLPQIYAWTFDPAIVHDMFGVAVSGSNGYEKTRALKRALSKEWHRAPEQRMDLANYAVRTWGGVKKNAASTMQGYVQIVSEGRVPEKHKGIASWSKVAAFSDPDSHAIFDARVSFSLNVIQMLSGEAPCWWFPHLAGQNKRLNACWPRLKAKATQQGWTRIETTQVYPTYIDLLTSVSGKLGVAMDEVEMLLFSKAEDLAREFDLLHPVPSSADERSPAAGSRRSSTSVASSSR